MHGFRSGNFTGKNIIFKTGSFMHHVRTVIIKTRDISDNMFKTDNIAYG